MDHAEMDRAVTTPLLLLEGREHLQMIVIVAPGLSVTIAGSA